MEIEKREIIHHTRFCDWVAKTVRGCEGDIPYYAVELPDYVCIIAVTLDQEILFVRQYRPAIEMATLELPSGCLEAGESVSSCGLRELREETGYVAQGLEILGSLVPDSGRLANRMWCLFARNVTLDESSVPELELVRYPVADVVNLIESGELNHALHLAAFLLAILKGRLPGLARNKG
jgi:ADP-ribose pyrophosphatase